MTTDLIEEQEFDRTEWWQRPKSQKSKGCFETKTYIALS